MDKLNSENFLVKEKIKLKDRATRIELDAKGKEKEKELEEISDKLSRMQDTMYAHNRYGVLVILQGMDTSGKDSLIREVFNNFNPRGLIVNSFKVPSSNELQHDYLWRHYVALPKEESIPSLTGVIMKTFW
jgi:polyphosphate kinase 2 (PPK2 family)